MNEDLRGGQIVYDMWGTEKKNKYILKYL